MILCYFLKDFSRKYKIDKYENFLEYFIFRIKKSEFYKFDFIDEKINPIICKIKNLLKYC